MFLMHAAAAPPGKEPQAVGTWIERTQPGKGRKLPQSKHYTIRSDLDAEETKEWGRHLDVMYEEYTRRLVQGGNLRPRSPEFLNVMMFARQQDYLDTLRTQFGINATGSGGMFFVTPRGGGLAFFTESLPKQRVAHVVQHEGFHQFAYAFFGHDMPPWLNEGLAEFFGGSVVDGKRVIIGQAPPHVLESVRRLVAQEKYLPFNELLQMTSPQWIATLQRGEAAPLYQQSWSMVHFLVYGDRGRYQGAFQKMLQLLNAGTRPYEAMRLAFGLTTDEDVRLFEARWKAHLEQAQPSSFIAAQIRLEFLAEGLRAVWNKGERPATLEELQKALVEAKFKYPMTSHGYTLVFDAADEANFTVPRDATVKGPVKLELIPSPVPRTAVAREQEAEHPTPPIIRTRGLVPRELQVEWARRKDVPQEFEYDVK